MRLLLKEIDGCNGCPERTSDHFRKIDGWKCTYKVCSRIPDKTGFFNWFVGMCIKKRRGDNVSVFHPNCPLPSLEE